MVSQSVGMVSTYSGNEIVNPAYSLMICFEELRFRHTVDFFLVLHHEERIILKVAEEGNIWTEEPMCGQGEESRESV